MLGSSDKISLFEAKGMASLQGPFMSMDIHIQLLYLPAQQTEMIRTNNVPEAVALRCYLERPKLNYIVLSFNRNSCRPGPTC